MNQKEKHFASKEKAFGQFFTPPEVANFMVRLATLNAPRKIGIDPSCGDGVFLKALLDAGFKEVIGIDIDEETLEKLPSSIKDKAKVFPWDGLEPFLGDIDSRAKVVVGNPPFSAKYGRVTNPRVLSAFELGKGRSSQAIEILFLERFIQLTSPEGVVGIILPASVFSALPLRYVRHFLLKNTQILSIVSLPRGIFGGNTTSKTYILFVKKTKGNGETFMGIAEKLSELPALLNAYTGHTESGTPPAFWVRLTTDDSFSPQFYEPTYSELTKTIYNSSWPVMRLDKVLSEMFCGRTEYGEKRRFTSKGIRFISAKTITTLGIDFSRDNKYIEPDSIMDKKRAYVYPGDVLFVRVGVGCSGRATVVVDGLDMGIADDWIYILRTKGVSPFYLAAYLYTEYGRAQVNHLKRGVGTVTIPQRLLKEVLVPIPSESFQQALEQKYREVIELRRTGYISTARITFEQMIASTETMIKGEKNEPKT